MVRSQSTEEIVVSVDRDHEIPIGRQIFEQFRSAILDGRLRSEDRLPSSRRLAKRLEVSRTVVLDAYDLLYGEGLVETFHGSGTMVSSKISIPLKSHTITTKVSQPSYASSLPAEYDGAPTVRYDFRPGAPSWDLFPRDLWARALARTIRRLNASQVGYGPAEGALPLRKALSRYLRLERGIRADAEEIIITSGATQAIDILARICISPKDVVIVEEPTHPVLREIFLRLGANIVPIPVDDDGCRIEEIDNELDRRKIDPSRVQLIYLTPTYQFPTGASLSLERRIAALNWAHENSTIIIEDDYDSELSHGNTTVSALSGLDPETTAFIGTFSKTMYPGIRIGYTIIPSSIRDHFTEIKWANDRLTQTVEQFALADFMESGRYHQHIQTMSNSYAERRRLLASTLEAHFGSRVTIRGTQAGLHLLATINSSHDSRIIAKKALSMGVRVYVADDFYLSSLPEAPTFLLGYAAMTATEIRKGIKIFAFAAESH